MTESIDTYIEQLAQRLTVDAATRTMILEEVQRHLDEATAQQVSAGMGQVAAETAAIVAFGPVQRVATRFNRTHPLAWDRQQLIRGILWGVVLSWLIWTLVAFPLLVASEIQQLHLIDGQVLSQTVGELLFAATPLAFGMFQAIANEGVWFLLPLLLLFGAVPFLWGWRASKGWLPGLAFGLGTIVGFPWLLPGMVYQAQNGGGYYVMFVIWIWLLCPYAMGMSWLGHRLAIAQARRSTAQAQSSTRNLLIIQIRRGLPYAAFSVVLVGLVVLNGWAWQQASSKQPAPVDQQLQTAQHELLFTLRQPSYLPAHVTLASVTVYKANQTILMCADCSVDLEYLGPDGASFSLQEWQATPSTPPSEYADNWPTNGYVFQPEATGGEMHQVWWLQTDITGWSEYYAQWTRNGIHFGLWLQLTGPAPFSQHTLQQIADSID